MFIFTIVQPPKRTVHAVTAEFSARLKTLMRTLPLINSIVVMITPSSYPLCIRPARPPGIYMRGKVANRSWISLIFKKATLQRALTLRLSINWIWPFVSLLISRTGKRCLLKAVYRGLVASASKQFFQVPPCVKRAAATQLLTSQESEREPLTVCVSSSNADEARSNLCKTPLQSFTVDWIIDRPLLVGCQGFPHFPKDVSNLPSQLLKTQIYDGDRFGFLPRKTKDITIKLTMPQ